MRAQGQTSATGPHDHAVRISPGCRVHVVRTPAIELEWLDLDGTRDHLQLASSTAVVIALAPIEVAWRGVRRPLAADQLHASRAGELTVLSPVAGPARLVVVHFTHPAPSERSLAELLARVDPPTDVPDRVGCLLDAAGAVDPAELADAQPQALEQGPVRRARLHLEAHYADAPSLTQLAALAEVSRFHLARAFCAYHAVPPHVYLNCVRVAHAREMLARDVPAVVVAARLGFVDQSHLTRRFHEIAGLTPSSYARASAGPA